MEQKVQRFWENNRKILIFCLIAVFVWGFAAHGYHFLNFQLSHDSLDGIFASGMDSNNDHKIELGRVFSPAYRYLSRGMLTMPWLLGFVGLIWIGLAAFLTASVLEIRSRGLLVLISGILAVNLAVTAQAATYINDFDVNMFALMAGCLAVYLWKKRVPGYVLLGGLAVGVSIGLYQSYVSITIALVMIVLILELMNGMSVGESIKRGCWAAVMVLLGGAVYFLSVRLITNVTGIPLAERSNSISALGNLSAAQLPALILGAYADWWDFFAVPHSTWLSPAVIRCFSFALLALTALLLVRTLLRKDLKIGQKALILLIALLLPLGMNACYILTSGGTHDLMKYAFVLVYVLGLLLASRCAFKPVKWLCSVLVCLLLWGGVQTSNSIYLKKTAVWNATYSAINNVVYDMLYYGYVPGETEVFIAGQVPFGSYPGFENVEDVIGVGHNNAITDDEKSIKMYFQYVLGDGMVFATEEQQEAIMATEDFEWMSRYPNEGYITIIEDVLVVKLN